VNNRCGVREEGDLFEREGKESPVRTVLPLYLSQKSRDETMWPPAEGQCANFEEFSPAEGCSGLLHKRRAHKAAT